MLAGPKDDYLAVITAYVPDAAEWSADFRKRLARVAPTKPLTLFRPKPLDQFSIARPPFPFPAPPVLNLPAPAGGKGSASPPPAGPLNPEP